MKKLINIFAIVATIMIISNVSTANAQEVTVNGVVSYNIKGNKRPTGIHKGGSWTRIINDDARPVTRAHTGIFAYAGAGASYDKLSGTQPVYLAGVGADFERWQLGLEGYSTKRSINTVDVYNSTGAALMAGVHVFKYRNHGKTSYESNRDLSMQGGRRDRISQNRQLLPVRLTVGARFGYEGFKYEDETSWFRSNSLTYGAYAKVDITLGYFTVGTPSSGLKQSRLDLSIMAAGYCSSPLNSLAVNNVWYGRGTIALSYRF